MKILFARTTPEVPLWMYYVRGVIDIICAIVDIFLLPFGRLCNLNTIWQGQMIRHMCQKRGISTRLPKGGNINGTDRIPE